MNPDVSEFAQVMAIIVGSVASLVVVALVARVLWRFGTPKSPEELAAPRDDERMQRLETAVDAIAIEVERISEGQRFVVGLLSEGTPARRAELKAGRVITPH
jgi:hypothetical protein